MQNNNYLSKTRMWRLVAGLIPAGVLLPALVLKGQDVPHSPNGWHQPTPNDSSQVAPSPGESAQTAGWRPRPSNLTTETLMGEPSGPNSTTSGWQRRTVTASPGLNTPAPLPSGDLPAPVLLPSGAVGTELTPANFQKADPDEVQLTPEQRALLGAARAAVGRGELRQAIIRFQEYLRANPKDLKVRREYTGILVRAKDLNQAIEQYQLLIQAAPDDPGLRLALGNVYLQLDRPKLAIPHLLIALKVSPNDTETAAQLARAYLGLNEPRNARAIFDRYLAALTPGDVQVPSRMGRILLDLGRPKQAIPFILALHKTHPDDLELLTELIRAKAWLGQRDEAQQLLAELARLEPQDVRVRLGLADALYRLSEYPLAGMTYAQVLQAEPQNMVALLGTARVNIRMYHVQAAAAFLESCQDESAQPELLALARGELYLAVGKYAEAIQILRAYLQRNEDDVDCRATLANVYEATQDYEKAKAEWTKLGLLEGQDERSSMGLALILGTQWCFTESNAQCEHTLVEEPESYKAVAQLVHNYGKMKKVEEAMARAQAYFDRPHEDEHGPVAVGLAEGRMLLEAGRYEEAAIIYGKVLVLPLGKVAATYFGLYYAQSHLHHEGQCSDLLRPILEGTLRDRMELADSAAGFNVNALIVEICGGVLAKSPQHLPSLLRLGEAELRLAAHDANIAMTVNTCHLILGLSPTNVRGRFILARAYALAQKYQPAFLEYDKLIRTDPDLLQARKELARVLYGANKFAAGNEQYQTAQYPTGGEVIQNALGHLALPDSAPSAADGSVAVNRGGKQPAPILTATARGKQLGSGIGVTPAAPPSPVAAVVQASAKQPAPGAQVLPSPQPLPSGVAGAEPVGSDADQEAECQRKLRRVEIDAAARAADAKALHEEQAAKYLKDLRDHEAVDAYLALLASQPDNTSARFDLLEMYGALNLTRASIDEANQLLDVEPYNRDAEVARQKASALLRPHIFGGVDLYSENGRDGLARIDRDQYTTQGVCNYGDEGDYLGAAYTRIALVPHNYQPLVGDIGSVLFGKQINDRLAFSSQTNFEEFPNRFKDRVTFDASLTYDVSDCWHAYVNGFLHNVEENGESLNQNIYKGGFELGSDYHITRELDATTWYRLSGYSDNNLEHEALIRASYRLLPPPFEIKFLSSIQFTSFDESNYLSGTNEPPLFNGTLPAGFKHPYFAPLSFFYFEERLTFKQTLSRDLFKYSDQCYYKLEYGLGVDARSAVYNNFKVSLNYDVNDWIKLGVTASAVVSSVYTQGGGLAYLELWIPPIH